LLPEQLNKTIPSCSRLREAALTLAAAGLVVLFCALLLCWDPRFFWIDDSQSGALPVYCEMARAWQSGEIPLLSLSSWRAGAIAAEFPAGVFSPSLALSSVLAFQLDLSLPLAAAAIAIFHLAILAGGAFRLARQRGLTFDLSLLVSLVASLNGWIILWGARNWGVCLFSFAWVPWFWWGLEYARQNPHNGVRFVPAGLFLGLLITAGWPITILMAAFLSAWVMVRTWIEKRSLLSLWPTPVAWVVGMGLSAPAWLMFLEYLPHGMRTQSGAGLWTNSAWSVPLDGLPGLILPNSVANWWVFGALKPHVCAELAGGLVPVVILLGCLWYGGRACLRDLRWDWALCGLMLVVVTSPAVGNFQYSFRWLPLFFLSLGLLAAQALDWLRQQTAQSNIAAQPARPKEPRRAPNLGRLAFYLISFACLRTMLSHPALTPWLLSVGMGLAIPALLWWGMERYSRCGSTARRAMPAVLVFLSCLSACATCSPFSEVPEWQISEKIREPGPLAPNIRYLSVHSLHDVFDIDATRPGEHWRGKGEELYLGNTAAYAGLEFVNGYSPVVPIGMQQLFGWEVHGSFEHPADARRILASESGPHGLLQLMGVDGLVVADRFHQYRKILAKNGWREVAQVKGGRVFHRNGRASPRVRVIEQGTCIADRFKAGEQLTRHGKEPLPSFLLTTERGTKPTQLRFAPAQVAVVEESRCSMRAQVTSAGGQGEILVVFSRPWFPGYQALSNGQPVPVEVYDLILPAVRLPAGTSGPLLLEYRPVSYVLGCRIALITACGTALILLVATAQRWLRRRQPDGQQAGYDTCFIPSSSLVERRLGEEVGS
jgi:hypothetical protein